MPLEPPLALVKAKAKKPKPPLALVKDSVVQPPNVLAYREGILRNPRPRKGLVRGSQARNIYQIARQIGIHH